MYDSNYFRTSGRSESSRSVNWGLMLLGFGAALLAFRLLAHTGAVPLLILGGIFTSLAIFKGVRGLTVPGGVFLGLAGGLIGASVLHHLSSAYGGAAIVGGLGAGFFLAQAIDRLRHPYTNAFGWTRIPGTVLLSVAALLAFLGTIAAFGKVTLLLINLWPAFLIVGGIWVIVSMVQRRRRNRW